MWRRNLPSFPLNCSRIEDRPDRPGAIIGGLGVFVHRHRRIKKIVSGWIELDVLAIAIVVWRTRIDLATQVTMRRIALGLVVEPLADLVHQDQILPILYVEAGGAHERKDRALNLPHDVIILRGESALGANGGAVLQGLIDQTPQRGPDRHGGELATGVLITIRFAPDLDHRGHPRIEHAAKVYIAGTASSGDDNRFGRAEIHGRFSAFDVPFRAKAP